MDSRKKLLEVIGDDPFNLLQEKIKLPSDYSEKDSLLIKGFEEIVNFVESNGREPSPNSKNIIEFKLYSRLKAIRADNSKIKLLKNYDFLNLLNGSNIREITIEDILQDDDLGLLDSDADTDIFKLRHVRATERISPAYMSRRKICKDFSEYSEMFETIHNELESHSRKLVIYHPSQLREGAFYVLNGIVLLLKSINGTQENFEYKSGNRVRFDGRTRCIFDNGTESDMLFRSLDKALQLDGYSISDFEEPSKYHPVESQNDVLNGYIYILRSRRPDLIRIRDLYKIGHTTTTVRDRIKNARNEATYLCDDVDIVRTYKCLNIKSFNLEQNIQHFFDVVRLNVKLYDKDNNLFEPKEWFTVPLEIVEEAISLIINGTIDSFVYDARIKQIVKRES